MPNSNIKKCIEDALIKQSQGVPTVTKKDVTVALGLEFNQVSTMLEECPCLGSKTRHYFISDVSELLIKNLYSNNGKEDNKNE